MSSKVSILIPTYNREDIISETIDCALAQDYPHFEIVICDNASTDRTWEIVSEYAQKHPQIKIKRNEHNLGAVRNWVACLELADGEYGKILWSDDLISKDFLSKTVPYMKDDVGFVYTATEVFENQVGTGDIYYQLGETGEYPSSVFIEGKLSGKDFPSSPGCAIFRLKDLRKNLLLEIPNSKNIDLTAKAVGNDLLIYLLTLNKYSKFVFIKDVMSFFRAHKTSITLSSKKGELMFMYQLAESYFVENTVVAREVFKKFNAKLLLSLLAYKGSLGIFQLGDFYRSTKVTMTDVSYRNLVSLIFTFIRRRVFKTR